MHSELSQFAAVVIMIILGHSLTTLFHELGHALPSLIFSRQPVKVYIGTYGTEEKYVEYKIGRLHLFFRINFFNWRIGMCQHGQDLTYRQLILIILGGPLASLTLFISLLILVLSVELSNSIIILCVIYMLLAIYDFMINMYPAQFESGISEQGYLQSDGMQLQTLLSFGRSYEPFLAIMKSDVDRASQLCKLYDETQNQAVGFSYIGQLVTDGSFQKAFDVFQRLFENKMPGIAHFDLLGDIYNGLGQKEDALKYYTTYLHQYPQDFNVKNKKAKVLLDLDQDTDALTLFQHSIRQNPHNNPDAYLYIGKILTKLKNSEAMDHFIIANKQSPNNPEILLSVAQLYEKTNRSAEAIKFYQLAEHFGSTYHGLEFKIATLGK